MYLMMIQSVGGELSALTGSWALPLLRVSSTSTDLSSTIEPWWSSLGEYSPSPEWDHRGSRAGPAGPRSPHCVRFAGASPQRHAEFAWARRIPEKKTLDLGQGHFIFMKLGGMGGYEAGAAGLVPPHVYGGSPTLRHPAQGRRTTQSCLGETGLSSMKWP